MGLQPPLSGDFSSTDGCRLKSWGNVDKAGRRRQLKSQQWNWLSLHQPVPPPPDQLYGYRFNFICVPKICQQCQITMKSHSAEKLNLNQIARKAKTCIVWFKRDLPEGGKIIRDYSCCWCWNRLGMISLPPFWVLFRLRTFLMIF